MIGHEWPLQLTKLSILQDRLYKRRLPNSEFIATYRHESPELYADTTARIKLHSVGFIYNLDASTS